MVADTANATWALSLLDNDLPAIAQRCSKHELAHGLEVTGRTGVGLLSRLTVELARRGEFNPTSTG